MPAGNLVIPVDGASEYNGAGRTPLSAITEAPEPKLSEETGARIRGGYLPSFWGAHLPSAPPTPPLPPAPPVPPAHPRPSAPEIVPADNLVPTLDGAGEYNDDGQTPLSAITEASEERGQSWINPSPSSGAEPRTPPLMSPADMTLPPSSFSEAAFSRDTLAPLTVMTPPSNSGSEVHLSENTALVSHEPPNTANGIILTGWPMSRPGGRRQLYFAYGSNLSTSQMVHRCPSSYLYSSPIVMLRGWEWFIGARGYASIRQPKGVEDKDAHGRIMEQNKVSGLLYSLDIYSESRLDQAEGVGEVRTGSYYKEALEVELLLPDDTRDPQPQTVWCLTYIGCSRDEDGKIRDEYKRRLKRGMIESSRLGLRIGGIFGPWQNEMNEAEPATKKEASLRGNRREKGRGRNLKRKISREGSHDCQESWGCHPVEVS